MVRIAARILPGLATLLATLVVGACTAPDPAASTDPSAAGSAGAGAGAGPSAPSATAASSRLGDTVTFPSGVSVTTGVPTTFRPTGAAFGTLPGGVAVRIPLTVTNRGHDTFDPGLVRMTLTYGGGHDASAVTDTDNNVRCDLSKPIDVGKSETTTCAFALPKPGLNAALQAEVDLGTTTPMAAVFRGSLPG